MYQEGQVGSRQWRMAKWGMRNPYLEMSEVEYYAWLWRWRRMYPSLLTPGYPPVTVVTLQQAHYEASAVSRWNPPRWW